MTVIINSVEIARPIEEVFDYLSDQVNELHWNPSVEAMEKLTDGPVRVGTQHPAHVPRDRDAGHRHLAREAARRLASLGTTLHSRGRDCDSFDLLDRQIHPLHPARTPLGPAVVARRLHRPQARERPGSGRPGPVIRVCRFHPLAAAGPRRRRSNGAGGEHPRLPGALIRSTPTPLPPPPSRGSAAPRPPSCSRSPGTSPIAYRRWILRP